MINKIHTKIVNLMLVFMTAVIIFLTNGMAVCASTEMAEEGVYVRQMARGYCTLASAVDMVRSKMYLEGDSSWPNVTQEKMKKTAWLNGAGLLHQFTYYGTTVTYSTKKCNTTEALINLLNEHPEGIEIYIRDLPHAVLLTRYDAATQTFYVADPVYDGEIPLMKSWQRKAGNSQNAVIRTIDAYWYISSYDGTQVPGDAVGVTAATPSPIEETTEIETEIPSNDEIINDEENNILNPLLENQFIVNDNGEALDNDLMVSLSNFTKSTVQLPYVNDYETTNFIDVDENAWYAPSVKAAYEMAMMIGISDTEFHVGGNITLAQTICVASRIHNIYHNNNYDFSPIGGESWFMPYVRYAKEKGIIDNKYDIKYNKKINYDQEALRIEFSEILSNSLPDEQITAIKVVDEIADVPIESDDERYDAVYQLYNAGVLIGDGEGFKPWRKITRAEIAAVISRMADASLRIE